MAASAISWLERGAVAEGDPGEAGTAVDAGWEGRGEGDPC